MSQYKLGKYAKPILTHLVLKGQEVQAELPELVGCSYRTVIREVNKLKEAGYVEHAGLIYTARKPRFVLRPTFFGILEVFMGFDLYSAETPAEMQARAQTLIEIAERYSDTWVVFEEWDYIAANKDLLALTLSAIKEWMARNTLPNKGVGRVSMRDDILLQCKHEIMARLLWGGDSMTGARLIFKPETLAYFKRNTILKKHMDEAIERQAELYKMRLVIIEAWAKGKLMSTVLEEWEHEWPKSRGGGSLKR